jgi:alanine racemase
MTRPARVRINLPALQHNFNRVNESAPASRVMAIIKANAYGHGLTRIARALPRADAFGVACVNEAITLREAGFDRRIVLLEGPFAADELRLISGYRLDVVLHHREQLAMLERVRLRRPLNVWLKIDTGMHRLGFAPTSVPEMVTRLDTIDYLGELRWMSHLACADDSGDDYTATQIEGFRNTVESLTGERSLANSAAVLAWQDAHYDWVRPGIMLYGASPLRDTTALALDLQPVMTLESTLIAVNTHQKGARVGYGGDWVCPETMPVGVAAIGYGDGYPRHAPAGMPVLINGRRAQLIGRVSMDMVCVDLRGHPGAAVGASVTLWGDGLPVDEVAASAGTIGYELLCSINSRVRCEYIE